MSHILKNYRRIFQIFIAALLLLAVAAAPLPAFAGSLDMDSSSGSTGTDDIAHPPALEIKNLKLAIEEQFDTRILHSELTVLTSAGIPVEDAYVELAISDPTGRLVIARDITNERGRAVTTTRHKGSGVFRVCVNFIFWNGHYYYFLHSEEPCQSIIYPSIASFSALSR